MISVKNLTKSYGDVTAIRNLTFDVRPGELFGFIGPDGGGKTTLFRILTTLLLADEGSATVVGLDVVHDMKTLRGKIGYMPGRFSLYQDLTVEENLTFFATVFGTTIQKNYDLIRDIYIQIEPFKNRRAGALSGGMKQKLALCCALIHKPEILLLDEPTTGVDAVSRQEFWQMLKRLQSQDMTIVVSTPYMDEASLCDRIALIQLGNILTIDSPANVAQSFTKPLFAIRAQQTYALIKSLQSYPETDLVYPFGEFLHFTNKAHDKDFLPVLDYLKRQNLGEINWHRAEPTIEDCFIHLMEPPK